MPKKKGFTLVELLVVVSIIAILSVIGIVIFTNTQKSARDAKRKADIDSIFKAYEAKYDGASGNYKVLTGSDFTSGNIPLETGGKTYSGFISNDATSFRVCAPLEIHTTTSCNAPREDCYCKSSVQGTPLAGSSLSHPISCDPDGTLDDGLVGYWKFDEGSGTSTVDSTGNGGSANLVNGPVWENSVNGSFGKALMFNGSNYVQAPQNAVLNSGVSSSFTFSLWVNPNSLSWSGLLHKGWSWLIDGGTGCLRGDGLSPSCSYLSPLPVPSGSWTNIVLTYNPSGGNNNLKVYTQGVYRASQDSAGNLNSTSHLYIGGPGGNSYLSGLIDDVRIYNRVLSDTEISSLYGTNGSGCLP